MTSWTGTRVSQVIARERVLRGVLELPSGQVIIGQHWSARFSTLQFAPIALVKGQTLR